MMTYPLVYMLIWTIPTTIRIYQATTGNSAPFAIGTVDKVSQHLPPALSNPSSSPILTILSSPRSNTAFMTTLSDFHLKRLKYQEE